MADRASLKGASGAAPVGAYPRRTGSAAGKEAYQVSEPWQVLVQVVPLKLVTLFPRLFAPLT